MARRLYLVQNAVSSSLRLPAKAVFLWMVWLLLLFLLASGFLMTFGEALDGLGRLDMINRFR